MAGINPWQDDKDILSGFKLGDPDSALILARKHGLLPSAYGSSSQLFPYHSIISSTTPSTVNITSNEGYYTTQSLKLLSILKELTELREKLDQVEHNVTCYMLDKSSADLLHVDMLDSKQKQLETLLVYFTDVVKNTERLVAQLQKVSVGSSLKVEAQHHRHTAEVTSLLMHLLNQLPEHCQLIEKLRQFQLKNDPYKISRLSGAVQVLVGCKMDVQTLQDHFNSQDNPKKE